MLDDTRNVAFDRHFDGINERFDERQDLVSRFRDKLQQPDPLLCNGYESSAGNQHFADFENYLFDGSIQDSFLDRIEAFFQDAPQRIFDLVPQPAETFIFYRAETFHPSSHQDLATPKVTGNRLVVHSLPAYQTRFTGPFEQFRQHSESSLVTH